MSGLGWGGASMHIRVERDLGSFAEQWDALLDQATRPSVFLRSWWLQAVVVGTPQFVLVFDGEELVGGCPLQQVDWHGVRLLEFIGSGSLEADHLDVVVRVGFEDRVRDQLFGWFARSGTRVVDLRGMNEDAILLSGEQGRCAEVMEVAPYSDLSNGFADFMAGRSKNLRRDVRQAQRRMSEAGVAFEQCDGSEVSAALDALGHMHAQQWGDESSFLAGWKRFRVAALAGFERGEVIVGQALLPTGEAIAAGVALHCDGVLFNYQSGRVQGPEWNGSGTFIDAALMQVSAATVELDWLRGTEQYKAKWATGERQLFRLRLSKGPRAWLTTQASRTLHAWLAIRARWQGGQLLVDDGVD